MQKGGGNINRLFSVNVYTFEMEHVVYMTLKEFLFKTSAFLEGGRGVGPVFKHLWYLFIGMQL